MKIEYLDRTGQHEIDLSNLDDSTDILENVEQVLASIGRNEKSLSKLKGTQYEKRYVNDFAEYQLIKYLCDLIYDKNLKIDELTKSKVDIVTNDNSEKDDKINELNQEIVKLNEEIKKQNDYINAVYNENEDLKRAWSAESVKNEKYIKEIEEEKDNIIKNAKVAMDEYQKNVDDYLQEIKDLKTNKQTAENEYKILSDKFNVVFKDYKKMMDTNEELQTELNNTKKLLEDTTKNNKDLENKVSLLEKSKNDIIKKAEDISKKAKKAEDELSVVLDKIVSGVSTAQKDFQNTYRRMGSEMETNWFEI